MSLEDAVLRLANAIGAGNGNLAVAEIIRERDQALKRVAELERNLSFARTDRDEYQDRVRKYIRQISALRGVITRMKSALKKGDQP